MSEIVRIKGHTTRHLLVEMTEEEVKEKTGQLLASHRKQAEAEAEYKRADQERKAAKAALDEAAAVPGPIAALVDAKRETRPVRIDALYCYDDSTVVLMRQDTGEVIEVLDMSDEQLTIDHLHGDFVDRDNVAVAVAQFRAKDADRSHLDLEELEDAEVADLIAEAIALLQATTWDSVPSVADVLEWQPAERLAVYTWAKARGKGLDADMPEVLRPYAGEESEDENE